MESPNFIVVDDFYDNPDSVFEFAASLDYNKTLLSATESLVSRERADNAKETLGMIADLVGVRPNWTQMNRIHEFWGFSSCGEFQLRTAQYSKEGRKHYHANGQWTGLVYLSKKSPAGHYGTRFYRHKKTKACHLLDLDKNSYLKIKKDSSVDELWETITSPEMRYNRLVLFDSRYFHAEPPGFGSNVNNGRLVQIFNFTSVDFKPTNPTL